jgi:glutathione S-transferase
MYRLFIANKNYSSWSLRPWALMRGLGIDFDEELHLFHGEGNYVEYRRFSPTGRVPCLHDGSTVVWDSLAIAEYLAERHAGVWPTDAGARAWARCASAEMHSGFAALRNDCSMSVGVRIRLHQASEALRRELTRLDELWCEGLERWGGPWLGGPDFAAVDAFYAPVAFRIQTYGLDLSSHAQRYCDQLLAHPALRAWEHEALAEAQRDDGHEREIMAAGQVLADLRAQFPK